MFQKAAPVVQEHQLHYEQATGTWFNPTGGVGAAGKGGQFMEPLVTGAKKAKDAFSY